MSHTEKEVEALKSILFHLNTFLVEIFYLNTCKHWICVQSLLHFNLNKQASKYASNLLYILEFTSKKYINPYILKNLNPLRNYQKLLYCCQNGKKEKHKMRDIRKNVSFLPFWLHRERFHKQHIRNRRSIPAEAKKEPEGQMINVFAMTLFPGLDFASLTSTIYIWH